MQWWIGQVTDPDKGEWGDALEKTRAADWDKDQKEIYSHRCRVRIVGYHGCEDDLADKDLPLAHVLLPPNTTTTGGCGETMQYQGGEVVVGFFFDGADGQQPVIFGTLFRQSFIKDELTSAQFNAKKQTCFVPYTPPKVRQTAGKTHITKNSPVSIAMSDGESTKTLAQDQVTANENITTDTFSPCEDNEISKISNTIKDFTRKMETLQQLNEASTYVDPIYGGIIDIKSEVKLATNKIHKSMTKLVRRGRSWLIQDTLDKLDTTLENKVQADVIAKYAPELQKADMQAKVNALKFASERMNLDQASRAAFMKQFTQPYEAQFGMEKSLYSPTQTAYTGSGTQISSMFDTAMKSTSASNNSFSRTSAK